jgi:acetyl-CoA carboxylase biotin carboxylase subunit
MRWCTEAALIHAVQTTKAGRLRRSLQPEVYMEKFPAEPAAYRNPDHGRPVQERVWLGERDCSMQRRHQKVIEEAPAPGIPRKLIERIGDHAWRRKKSVTAVQAPLSFCMKTEFYFIEMNTRVREHRDRVDHGVDIVRTRSWWPLGNVCRLCSVTSRALDRMPYRRGRTEFTPHRAASPTGTPWWRCAGGSHLRQLLCAAELRLDDRQIIVHGDTREQALALRHWLAGGGGYQRIPLHRDSWWMPIGRWHNIHSEEAVQASQVRFSPRWSFRYFAACVNGFFVASMFELILLAW